MVKLLFLILGLTLLTAGVSGACRYSESADMCCDKGEADNIFYSLFSPAKKQLKKSV